MGRWYELKMEPDDNDTWMVTAPAFPEVTSFGDTHQQACENARNAIEEAIAARIVDGDDIPAPLTKTKGKGFFVELPILIFLKAALYMVARGKNVSRAELARRMDVHRETVDRLFRLDHHSRMDQIEAAFEAIGVPISVSVPFDHAA